MYNLTINITVSSPFFWFLTDFLTWFTISVCTVGVLLGLISLHFLFANRNQLIFLSTLVGITAGNLTFLSLVLLNLLMKMNEMYVTIAYCYVSLFTMGISREFPYLCMVAISMEQFTVIWRNTFKKVRIAPRYRQLTIVGGMAFVCVLANIWTIPLTMLEEDRHCLMDLHSADKQEWRTFRLVSLVLVDLVPIFFMICCHAGLIYKVSHVDRRKECSNDRLVINIREAVSIKRAHRRKITILQLIYMVTAVSIFNFPKILLNIIDDFVMENTDLYVIFTTVAYCLYHTQYVIDAFYVKLPLFLRRKGTSSDVLRSSPSIFSYSAGVGVTVLW